MICPPEVSRIRTSSQVGCLNDKFLRGEERSQWLLFSPLITETNNYAGSGQTNIYKMT